MHGSLELLQFHFPLRVLSELDSFHISGYNGGDDVMNSALVNFHVLFELKVNLPYT